MSNPPRLVLSDLAPRWPDVLRRRTQLYLAAGMALLISTLVASYMQSSIGVDALEQIERINQRGDRLDRLHTLLLDAETATRGYLLTRDPAYLAPYREAVPKITVAIRAIELEPGGDPDQRAAAARLVQSARGAAASLDRTVEYGKHNDAPEKSWLDHDKLAMDAYRGEHAELKTMLVRNNARLVKQSADSFRNARISAVLLALASLLLLVLAIAQSHRQQELSDRITELMQADNQRLEREVLQRTAELTNLATYLTHVRETEKLNLARELHDELGALLTAAKLDADWIERKLPAETPTLIIERLARMRQSLIQGITLKRRITDDLRPALLFDLGLIEALRTLADEVRQGGEIDLQLELPQDEPELGGAVSLSLFRIVQEGFTNIRKYAQARHVRVALRVREKAVELSIGDDGVGFDPGSPKLARHGLAGIKHRVYTHGGTLEIRAAPGAGVTIRVVIPV